MNGVTTEMEPEKDSEKVRLAAMRQEVEPDFRPLLLRLIERTHEGKVDWKQSSGASFVATVANKTYKVGEAHDDEPPHSSYAYLRLLNEKGTVIWEVTGVDVHTLEKTVRRHVLRLDDFVSEALEELDKL